MRKHVSTLDLQELILQIKPDSFTKCRLRILLCFVEQRGLPPFDLDLMEDALRSHHGLPALEPTEALHALYSSEALGMLEALQALEALEIVEEDIFC